MTKTNLLFERLVSQRLVALLSPKEGDACLKAYRICEEEEIVLEIAFRTRHAERGIRSVLESHPDALLLAGTVMTADQAEAAVAAGVSGVVSADYIPEVVEVCVKHDVICIPGGLADAGKQLSRKAALYGCSLEELKNRYPYQWIYKLFPAFSGSKSNLDLVTAWRGPFKGLRVVYTGGVDRDSLAAAARKDPLGIFCGSALTRDIDDPDRMRDEIREWKRIVRTRKEEKESYAPEPEAPSAVPKKFRPRIVTCGELMLRLSPPVGERLSHTRGLALEFGGAEANVAVALARFGAESVFVSGLPDNDLGDNAESVLRGHGVDTGFTIRKGNRMGIYFLEHGTGPRPSRVIYDRTHSAVSQLSASEIDWECVLEGADWFHWTGITPALSDSLAEVLAAGLRVARSRGIKVSVDLNYRKKLWSEDKARAVMSELMPFVDVCIGNEEDPTRIFGIRPAGTDVENGRIDLDGYRVLAEELMERFGFKKVAVTLRESLSASENIWSACLFDGETFLHSRRHRVWIVDRVGSGDAFAAGLIFSLLRGKPDREALEFGVAAAVLKHSIRGDFNLVSTAEVERAAAGATSGRIRR